MTGSLVLAGVLAGFANFFVNYLSLPFGQNPTVAETEDPPQLKDIWWVALIGYTIIGLTGACLVYVVDAWVTLKGMELGPDGKPKSPNFGMIVFGYGVIFGYSTTRLLVGLLDSIIKRIGKIEATLKRNPQTQPQTFTTLLIDPAAQEKIDRCEEEFEAHKSDCSGFVKAVSAHFGVTLTGQADDIVDQINGAGWTHLADGAAAKVKADSGWLVVAGLKGADHDPPRSNGHVVMVVSGGLAHNKYPTGYWGTLGATGRKNTTINYAWNAADRDQVIYRAKNV